MDRDKSITSVVPSPLLPYTKGLSSRVDGMEVLFQGDAFIGVSGDQEPGVGEFTFADALNRAYCSVFTCLASLASAEFPWKEPH